jgi:hypothetical protein
MELWALKSLILVLPNFLVLNNKLRESSKTSSLGTLSALHDKGRY